MRAELWSCGLDDGKSSVLPIRKKAERIITSTVQRHCHLLIFLPSRYEISHSLIINFCHKRGPFTADNL